MARTPWKPTTDEQRAVVAKLDEVAAKAKALWDIVEEARQLGVPKDVIAEHAKPAISRATLYRQLRKNSARADETEAEQ